MPVATLVLKTITYINAPAMGVKCTDMKLIFIIFLLFFQTACSDYQSYCDRLKSLAESEVVHSSLEKWIEINISNESTEHLNMRGVIGMMPGDYKILEDKFDWSIFGFNDFSQINIIGKPNDIDGLYFGERSMNGLLIKVSDHENFGLHERFKDYIHKSSNPSVAALCIERD